MSFFHHNDDQIHDSQNENYGENPGSYNYSWNNQDPIYPKDPKNKTKQVLKVVAGAFALVFGISVISLAVYGGYTVLNGRPVTAQTTDQQQENLPQMTITDIDNYEQINEPEVREGEPLTAVQAIKKVNPSVVGVVSTVTNNYGMMGKSTGSGVIMTEDGYIITNAHVVAGATSVSVVFSDSSEEEAKIVGQDEKSDLAVLKINKTGLTAAEFGNSDNLEVGETVVAIGNPLGLELFGTAVDGMISAKDRQVTIEDRTMTLLQTSAPINEGNSGGPLINLYGQVIGINSAKISGTGVEGISFAIPINSAKPVIDSLIQNGYVKDRPLLGISGSDVDARVAQYYDLPQGVLIRSVTEGSGAEAAGLKEGDIITMADDQVITCMDELNKVKDTHKAGEEMKLRIVREGQAFNVTVKLMEEKPSTVQ